MLFFLKTHIQKGTGPTNTGIPQPQPSEEISSQAVSSPCRQPAFVHAHSVPGNLPAQHPDQTMQVSFPQCLESSGSRCLVKEVLGTLRGVLGTEQGRAQLSKACLVGTFGSRSPLTDLILRHLASSVLCWSACHQFP